MCRCLPTIALVAVCILLATVVAAPPTRAEPAPPVYGEPVVAPVVDGFRPPEQPYGPGNRGIEYATEPGTVVGAAAEGEVIFAGPVAGELHVTVAHADGVRTSYSFLAELLVVRGQRVSGGQAVGLAGARLHVGARTGDAYIDPAALWAGGPGRVRLVPIPEVVKGHSRAAQERSHFLEVMEAWRGPGTLARGLAWARDRLEGSSGRFGALAHQLTEVLPVTHAARLGRGLARWWSRRDDCTPAATVAPTSPERRVAVLVGGLGSTDADAAIDDVDTLSLGYDPGDVLRYSYRGGRTPARATPTAELAGLVTTTYDAAATQGPLATAARRLADLLADLASRVPGVPVDVLAHSQGGVVARLALDLLDRARPPVDLGTVVTLGSPHQGADLATIGQAVEGTDVQRAISALRRMAGVAVDPWSPSARAMGETSALVERLADRAVPERYEVLSVAARADVVVPAGRTRLRGARSVTVAVPGLHDHDGLPGSDVARREIALALGGLPITCEPVADVIADLVLSDAIGWATDGAGLALGLLGGGW